MGIIPALAGNTIPTGLGIRQTSDHPRSRGEYLLRGSHFLRGVGSSPLSRGIRVMFPSDHPDSRIIPALAGNTARLVLPRSGPPDHPRSRGEYGINGAVQQGDSGSSPLSRGIPRAGLLTSPGQGIIPALAGNTWSVLAICGTRGDHPRSRGEYLDLMRMKVSTGGSSPLSRGIHAASAASSVGVGIIPALAGNTACLSAPGVIHADHPRSRGEYTGAISSKGHGRGSSPLSRGIPTSGTC